MPALLAQTAVAQLDTHRAMVAYVSADARTAKSCFRCAVTKHGSANNSRNVAQPYNNREKWK